MKWLIAILIIAAATLGSAQVPDNFGRVDSVAPVRSGSSILGLSDVELGENGWGGVISRNQVGMTYSVILSNNDLGLGPNTRQLLEEIQDAEIRTDPSVQKWMQASLRMQEGRILDTYWRHELSVGGPPTTSSAVNVGIGNVDAQIGTRSAEKSLYLKLTYLPTMKAKAFAWTARYEPVTLDAFSYERGFLDGLRNRGLPSFYYRKWEHSDPRIRAGLVAVGKLWEKVDAGMADVKAWMRQVSQQ